MNDVATAKTLEANARAQEAHHLAVLKSLNAQVQDARDDVQHMAYEAYVNGPGVLADMAALVDLVSRGGEASKSAGTLDYLAQGRSADEVKFRALATQQQAAAAKAVAARVAREAATAKAVAAQAAVTAALLKQRAAISTLQEVRQQTADQLGELGYEIELTTTPLDLDAINNLVTTPLCTQDNGDFPNGFFPASALCPIDGHPADMMRPVAARGLNALKKAYEQDLGERLCITDTYRPYHEQVIVAQQSPGLAAKPGRSKHGLGLAVDLCGGVENFGTREHLWMKQHAPLFGFYHPAWAEPTGSMPEPWHWEYAN
ncbi:MAG: D-alanyl-D-alanine carboxypeptidase family protein [Austwickia sp.]|nr:D-alanyl-D-alanine carboxypeptidase family protein [Austwickia sp.]